jgi:glutaredoxin 3
MSIVVYTKTNCHYCNSAKMLLTIKQKEYTEVEIGKDILREDFMEKFADVRSAPLIVIDGVKIGGYDQLKEYFDSRP